MKKSAKKSKASFDVLKHVLVPEHIKLTKKEQNELFEKYKITHSQLLKIRADDPAIVHLNVEEGDVIKIVRKGSLQSPTAGEYLFYRGVIDAQK